MILAKPKVGRRMVDMRGPRQRQQEVLIEKRNSHAYRLGSRNSLAPLDVFFANRFRNLIGPNAGVPVGT